MKHMKRTLALLLALALTLGAAGASAEHYAAARRNYGACGRLVGVVKPILVFVSTPKHPWTERQRSRAYNDCVSSGRALEQQAGRWNVWLSVECLSLDCSIPCEAPSLEDPSTDWYDRLMRDYFHRERMEDLTAYYRQSLNADETPILFLFNSSGRSYAYAASRADGYAYPEYVVLFSSDKELHGTYMCHELLHLFGAIDLYDLNGEGVERAFRRYYRRSVMNAARETEVDPLTAYLVGWTSAPAGDAQRLMDDIARARSR